jgi:hypothetical protein
VRRRSGALGVAALLALASAPGCDAPRPDALRLDFEGAGAIGDAAWTATNRGSADVDIAVATLDGGRAREDAGRTGGRSIRLPAHDPWAPAPRAAFTVTPTGGSDGLDPGTGPFEFGADVRIDATSATVASSSVDDGDNLVQRGLWGDPAQWKLELDRHRPGCRIKGRSGTVSVTGTTLAAGRWYRIRCRRSGDEVTLTVGRWGADGTLVEQRWRASGPTGSLRPSSPSTPLSVGGKALAGGRLEPATDQCNGRIDEVVVRFG